MTLKGFRYVYMDAAGDGEGGGAGGASAEGDSGASSGAAAEGQTGANGADTGSNAAGSNTGSSGEGTALQQGQQAPQIPEKYQVKKEDGSIDIEASALKLADAYGHLEKRMGSGDVPPKSADEYQITVPDALKDTWKPEEDSLLQDFKKDAHAKGLTQAQFDFVMNKYMEIAPGLVEGSQKLSAEDCTAELRNEWKTDEQYKAEVGKAYKAAVAYGDKDADGIIKDYGNDPRIVRLLSRVGNELGEDVSLNPGGGNQSGQSVEALMSSEAYTNPKHPDHASVSAQVRDYYKAQEKAAAKSGALPLI